MSALKKILAVLAVALVALYAVVSTQPDRMHVERSKVIQASPADLFPYANDFDQWLKWNPWKDLDTNQTYTFSDSRVGVGAWYTWKGERSGSGKMTITAAVPEQSVSSSLDFIEPFASHAEVVMTFTPEGEGTKVTWGFDSEQAFMAKLFGMFNDMDAMLGADFEKGLNTLAPMAEADAAKRKQAEADAAAAAAAAAATVDPSAAPADPSAAPPAKL